MLTVARVRAIEITLDWRWAPVLALGTWLLAQDVLPARFPTWDVSTTWLTAAAAVLAGEVALLLHELAHAVFARSGAPRVTRIVFHGFRAQTIVAHSVRTRDEALIALAGPAVNLLLASVVAGVRVTASTVGALDAFLLMLAIGNAAAAALSLAPVGASDGARALSALRRRRRVLEREIAGQRQDQHDQDQQA